MNRGTKSRNKPRLNMRCRTPLFFLRETTIEKAVKNCEAVKRLANISAARMAKRASAAR